ncbi:MAG: hypothetical protein CMB99_03440 [Flavobacteriaceae bacterium]|nr:hypothetical protein [Flavobacteriaceae bacterium]|tara:strand:+ start:165398 stop:165982 length:585 start_codon:yes stop_codon:yes gene_type:complete
MKTTRTTNRLKKILLFFICIPLLTACCSEEVYRVSITGLQTRSLLLDGNRFVDFDKQNPIDKEDLLLEVTINELEELTLNERQEKLRKPRVQLAAVVPCPDPQFIYTHQIENVRVTLFDLDNNNNAIDVTSNIIIYGSQQSLADYISENPVGLRDLLLDFSNTTSLPNRMNYLVKATLDDGTTVEVTGDEISFN